MDKNVISFNSESLDKWLESILPGLSLKAEQMEALESWVINHPDLSQRISEWAVLLDKNKGNPNVVFSEDSFFLIVKILAYLHAKKAFKLVELSSSVQPGLGGDLLKFCNNNALVGSVIKAESNLFISRIRELVRINYYEQIFGPERRMEVLNIISDMEE